MTSKRSKSRISQTIYGVHPVTETLAARRRTVYKVFASRSLRSNARLHALMEKSGARIKHVASAEMNAIAGSPHHQGIAAEVSEYVYADLSHILASTQDAPGLILMLDAIQDPGNLGSILRSAECFGAAGVIVARDRSVSVTPAVEKASAGAAAHLPVAKVTNLVRAMEAIKKAGYWIYAAEATSETSFYSVDLTGKVALVLGSEGRGLRRLVRAKSDLSMSIPLMGRIESLNVAQCAAILLGEAARQRSVAQRD